MTTPNDGPTDAAAWYPDTNAPGTERWYDGTAWTEHTRPMETPAAPTPAYAQASTSAPGIDPNVQSAAATSAPSPAYATPAQVPSGKRPWYTRKAIVIPVGVLAGIILIGGIGGALGGKKQNTAATPPETRKTTEVVAEQPTKPAEVEKVAVPTGLVGAKAADAAAALKAAGFKPSFEGESSWKVLSISPSDPELEKGAKVTLTLEQPPTLTLGQKNAIKSAQSYLSLTGFSRAGLAEQLTSEYGSGFDPADAEFALAYLEQNGLVDWNAEAAESAKSYLELTSFSREGLYEQLTSEYGSQFTPEQANAGLAAVGY